MRLTGILLLAGFLQVNAHGTAQTITYTARATPLTTVLSAIEQQTGYSFFYDKQDLPGSSLITVDLQQTPLQQALEKVLSDKPVNFIIRGKTIFLTRKEPAAAATPPDAAPPADVHGRVTDSAGNPLNGANVFVKGRNKGTTTDENGEFLLKEVKANDIVVISFIGYSSREVPVAGRTEINIMLKMSSAQMGDVTVRVNTGYQNLPKERATGSFVQLDKEILNRSVSTNLLDRLLGVTVGLSGSYQGTPSTNAGGIADPANRRVGLFIRGVSTLSDKVGTDPLIVLDNFPYEGDLNNINPNDIESVTVLKDAAAASVWGVRAGNGVIVLTTKKGRLNHPMEAEFNSSLTVVNKPDIFKDPFFLDASDYIDMETYLFNKGYYNSSISNTNSWPVLSPVVEILTRQRAGQLSAADATTQINALRGNDVRNDVSKYFYHKAVNSQNAIRINGGTDKLIYSLSVGYDKNTNGGNLVGNGFNRITVNTINTYKPVKNLEITTALNYGQSKYILDGNSGTRYRYPYDKLADANGNPLPINYGYRNAYIDSLQQLGFLDWQYRPLQELKNVDNTSSTNDLLARISIKYRISQALNIEADYQNETQHSDGRNYQDPETYNVRNMVNRFSQYNPTTGSFTYPFPQGGILQLNNTRYNVNNYRGQINFDKRFNADNELTAIAGGEIRLLKTIGYSRTSYGYDDQIGTSTDGLNYADALPIHPSGYGLIPSPDGSVVGVTQHTVSYFANAAYTYQGRYTLSVSGKKDGANIFGVNANDRITPLWSAGGAWNISKEHFYRFDLLPYLKLRATYGYNGNIYNGTAYVTGRYSTTSLTGAQEINSLTPPNPDLRWERVKNINIGIDFALKKNIIAGTIELYKKEGLDLVEPLPLAASTGFTAYTGNAAATRTNGLDLSLTSKNLDGPFSWKTTLLLGTLHDAITRYDVPQTANSIESYSTGVKGKPIYAIYSYKWAGLDPTNGDPQGYLNGKVSKDYVGIINNYEPDSLLFNGSARPTIYGNLRNDFSFKGFSLSVNIGYKLGYFFRRYSISPNYIEPIAYGGTYMNVDYAQRWQKPGDEKTTNVPSLVYPSNNTRSTFYQYSSILVTKGDNIRLQDLRLAYDLTGLVKKSRFKAFQVYAYANNLSIIWRANKYNIDPDAYGPGSYAAPFSIAFGINATF